MFRCHNKAPFIPSVTVNDKTICDDVSDIVLIENNGPAQEWGVATHFQATLLLPPANEVWGKVIFSEACEEFCSQGGGGIPACIAGGIPACLAGIWGWVVFQYALQVVSQYALHGGISRPTPRRQAEGSGRGESPGPHRGGSPGPHPGGLCIPACTKADPPPPVDGYCRGRYASYWNAFLFSMRTLLLTSSLSCLSIDANAWCERTLGGTTMQYVSPK